MVFKGYFKGIYYRRGSILFGDIFLKVEEILDNKNEVILKVNVIFGYY